MVWGGLRRQVSSTDNEALKFFPRKLSHCSHIDSSDTSDSRDYLKWEWSFTRLNNGDPYQISRTAKELQLPSDETPRLSWPGRLKISTDMQMWLFLHCTLLCCFSTWIIQHKCRNHEFYALSKNSEKEILIYLCLKLEHSWIKPMIQSALITNYLSNYFSYRRYSFWLKHFLHNME